MSPPGSENDPRTPLWDTLGPKNGPKCPKRCPQGAPASHKVPPGGPKGTQRCPQAGPKGVQKRPQSLPQGKPKSSQKRDPDPKTLFPENRAPGCKQPRRAASLSQNGIHSGNEIVQGNNTVRSIYVAQITERGSHSTPN